MMISNLPVDLLEDILTRVPVTSIGSVRSTCKSWNVLTKDQSFANKHIEKATASSQRERVVLVITGNINDHAICVTPYDFHNKTFDPSINRKGILITRENPDQLGFLHRVFYCNGLLLRIWRGFPKHSLLVCNPYWGQTRWVSCPTKERSYEMFAFGYDKSCGSHKILRSSSDDNMNIYIDIYDLSSDSWKTRPHTAFLNYEIKYTEPGVTLKGNSYWYAEDIDYGDGFLQCFDFTRERFGPQLHLPFHSRYGCSVSLSSVKEEKLAAMLKQQGIIDEIEVWVTDKIEPDAVSWSKLFKVELLQLLYYGRMFESFLIDEEKKTVVVFDIFDRCGARSTCIIDGESGDVRDVLSIGSFYSKPYSLVGCYVPSSVQI